MRRAGFGILLAVWLAVPAFPQATSGDEAIRAFRAGRFRKAARLAREYLADGKADEDIRFMLSRALAYGGDYFEAVSELEPLLKVHPKNTDYILLWARIEFWQGNVAAAEAVFDDVLKIAPDNPEALAGKGRVAAARNADPEAERLFLQSLAVAPNSAEVHFALGSLYRRQGEYEKARECFLAARRLEPANPDYKKAVTRAPGRSDAAREIRLTYQPETFSDGRGRYHGGQAALIWRLPNDGPPLVFKTDSTRRFGYRPDGTQKYDFKDTQIGLEIYPRLWKGANAYADFTMSPGGATLYPKASGLLEVYQALTGSWDASLGYRYMDFDSQKVSIYFGSLGVYFGPFYTNARVYYCPGSRESVLSWIVLTRWYFKDRSYAWAGYGRGTRSVEIVAVEDLDFQDVWTAMVGLDWTVFRNLHLLGAFTRLTDRGEYRDTLMVGLGFKWGK